MRILTAFYDAHGDQRPDPQKIRAEINWYRSRYPDTQAQAQAQTHSVWEERMYRAAAVAHGGVDPRAFFATLGRSRTPPQQRQQQRVPELQIETEHHDDIVDSSDTERTESEDEEAEDASEYWTDAGDEQTGEVWRTQPTVHRSVLKGSDSQLIDSRPGALSETARAREEAEQQELYRMAWAIGKGALSSASSNHS
jgi:hypothetical protein